MAIRASLLEKILHSEIGRRQIIPVGAQIWDLSYIRADL